MGIQTMGSQSNGQQSHLQPCQLKRQNSWHSLTLTDVETQLGNLGKPLVSMNLNELLNNVWSTEDNQCIGMNIENTSLASSLQRQTSLTLARALSGKTVDQVWKEIQQGQKKRLNREMNVHKTEPTLDEITLEDFLVQAGLFAKSSLSPSMEFVTDDVVNPQSFPQTMVSSSSPSTGALSDATALGRKRAASDALERSIERRLRRRSRIANLLPAHELENK